MFLFNPLTFQRDAITYHHYTRYRKPTQYIISTNLDDKRVINDVDDDVRKIFKELKESECVGLTIDKDLKTQLGIPEKKGELIIKTNLKLGEILSEITWYGEDLDICSILMYDPDTGYRLGFNGFIKMTSELQEHLNRLFMVVSISSSIDEYTPVMSSVPGFPLTVSISGEEKQSNIAYSWKAQKGEFLSWSDGTVNILGNECTIEESTIYWIPNGEIKENNNTFEITVEVKNNESQVILGQKTIEINCSKDFMYSILK
jgi:hypothetical protein